MSVVNVMRVSSSIRSFWADRLKGAKRVAIDECANPSNASRQ